MDPSPVFGVLSFPSLLQAWETSYGFKTKLLVDEEEEDSQKNNKDPNSRQEANGFRSDWQENTEEKNIITIKLTQRLVLTNDQSYSEFLLLWNRVRNTLQGLDFCWHPQDCVQGQGKDRSLVSAARLACQMTECHTFVCTVSSTWSTTLLTLVISLLFEQTHKLLEWNPSNGMSWK